MSDLVVDKDGRTLRVTIDRPQARNALTRPVIRGLRSAIDSACADAEVRCIVLTGRGEHFSAGADLKKNFLDDPALLSHVDEYMDEYHAVIQAIVRSTKPVIAMMDGAAVGFGADLALACDLRVATPRAYVQERFVELGLMPDGGGTFWLPRLVGTARAMQMMLLAERVDATRLWELGVVNLLVEPEELLAATMQIARKLENAPPLAVEQIRRAVYASLGDVAEALRREREGQLRLLASADVAEGIAAWVQKRPPVFQGR